MRILPAFVFWAGAIVVMPGFDASGAVEPKLTTHAEKSGWTETGRYEEVTHLCRAYEKAYRGRARCIKFGTTPEGREMLAIVASESGALSAQPARAKKLPVVLAQGGIHAGEIDGKDAGFFLLREMLEGRQLKGALKKLVFVFVPVFNVDGHERFGAHNRPNQIGPKEMGWRVTAQNLNLNRDYVKAEAPEMQAMIRLLNEWDPILYADLHVTDGAEFRHDVSVRINPTLAGPEPLRKDALALRDGLMARLKELKHLPLHFYPSFKTEDDPSSGIEDGIPPPRFSDSYAAARNRIGVLVETHSWKNYAQRVRSTIDTLAYLLEMAAEKGTRWTESSRLANQLARGVGGKQVVLEYEATKESKTIEFLGYEYERAKSEVSGALMTRYDSSKPQVWKIPFFGDLAPKVIVQAPRHAYYVPVAQAPIVEPKLKLHGIDYVRLAAAQTVEGQTWRCTEPKFKDKSSEGRQPLELCGGWAPEKRELPVGSLSIPIAQPKSALVMHLFEPGGEDSLVRWGYFNAYFEQKEYMEPYVAEKVAREMLKGPDGAKLKAEFEKKLDEDKEFAKDADKRLDFFYRKHSSWDERFGLYPVLRK